MAEAGLYVVKSSLSCRLLEIVEDGRRSNAYLLLSEIVGEVSDHDLCGGWDAVLGWATLLGLPRSTCLAISIDSGLVGFVGDIGERNWILSKSGGLSISSDATSSTTSTATTSASTTPATTRGCLVTGAFTLEVLLVVLWLASKLDGDLAFEDVFA